MAENISCCYFPTTILLIDDKPTFLKNISLKLDKKITFELFDKPYKALSFLREDYKPCQNMGKWLLSISEFANEDDGIKHHTVGIDISSIHHEVYNPHRFSEVSVILVDYAMPHVNGVEFCRQLKDLPVKKVLVTGEADHRVATQAFNEHVIDKFILKDSPDFFEQINQTIFELQHAYFQSLSAVVIKNLTTNLGCSLNDPLFVDFLNSFFKENRIEEYYLIDEFGSFLLLDIDGKPSLFIVKNAQLLEDYYDIAKENGAPQEIQIALKSKTKIPFFFTETDEEVPVNQWATYLHQCHEFKGKKGIYYYAYINDASIYAIDRDRILSYRDFLRDKYSF